MKATCSLVILLLKGAISVSAVDIRAAGCALRYFTFDRTIGRPALAGNTHGAMPPDQRVGEWQNTVRGTVIGDPDPLYDECSDPGSGLIAMSGRNVGDLLNEKGVTWGGFQGGFRPTGEKDGKVVCRAKSINIVGKEVKDRGSPCRSHSSGGPNEGSATRTSQRIARRRRSPEKSSLLWDLGPRSLGLMPQRSGGIGQVPNSGDCGSLGLRT
jgi:hypothetical protein